MKSINQKSHSPWSGLLEGKRERKKGDKKEKNKRGGGGRSTKHYMKLTCLSRETVAFQ